PSASFSGTRNDYHQAVSTACREKQSHIFVELPVKIRSHEVAKIFANQLIQRYPKGRRCSLISRQNHSAQIMRTNEFATILYQISITFLAGLELLLRTLSIGYVERRSLVIDRSPLLIAYYARID